MISPRLRRPTLFRCSGRSAVLVAAVLLAPLAARAQDPAGNVWISDDSSPTAVNSRVHVILQADEDGLVERHAVEVRLEDGDLTIRMNGKEIPQDRMRIEDGTIVVLDENGEPIESVHLNIGTGSVFGSGFVNGPGTGAPGFGAGGGNDFFFGAVEEPKVMLGIHLGVPDEALEHHLRLEAGTTTMVTAIYEGLPAHAAGLERFDVITEIDGVKPADPRALRAALAGKEPGDRVSLRVISAGRPTTVEITLDAYDAEAMAAATLIGDPVHADGFFRMLGTPDGDRVPGRLWSVELEKLPNVLVAPDQRLFELPGADPMPRGMFTPTPGAAPGSEEELDARLERLDERMKMLERILDQALEHVDRERTTP